jgi:hypothetical protein
VLDEVRAERAKKPPAVAVESEKTAAGKTNCRTASKRNSGKERVVVKDGQKYIKKTVLQDLDLIADGLVKKAKAGGTAQLKLLWELGKLDEDPTAKAKRRAPSLSALLMKEIRTKQAAKKAASK